MLKWNHYQAGSVSRRVFSGAVRSPEFDRAPRHQAVEHSSGRRRNRQTARFRFGQIAGGRGDDANPLQHDHAVLRQPEQLRGEPATTLSDVYSLGAVLYLLIAGEKPFGDDLVTRLRDQESGTVTLHKPLPGDLDAVVRKALAPAASERYSSVEQLAEDVRRYGAGEAVLAHAPSFRYQAGKFARRNKLALGAALLLLLTVLAGIGGVLSQYRAAVAERRKAEARA
jgi:hypothetical protein